MISPLNRLLIVGTLALLTITSSFVVTSRVLAYQAEDREKQQSFEAEIWSYALDGTENGVHSKEGVLFAKTIKARKSDGTRLLASSNVKVGLDQWARRIDYPDGRYVRIAEAVAMKSTGFGRPKAMTAPPAKCKMSPEEHVRGEEAVSGVGAFVIETTDASSGTKQIEWRVPAFGCIAVRYEISRPDASGADQVLSRSVPVRIQLGEPDGRLFLEQPSLQEAAPSEVFRRFLEQRKISEAECKDCTKGWIAMDRKYFKGRLNAGSSTRR